MQRASRVVRVILFYFTFSLTYLPTYLLTYLPTFTYLLTCLHYTKALLVNDGEASSAKSSVLEDPAKGDVT